MLQTYIGVADRHGLCSLHTENEHTLQMLGRHVQPATTILFWTLLEDSAAKQIWLRLSHRNRRDAWRFLEANAFDIGTVHPSEFGSDMAA